MVADTNIWKCFQQKYVPLNYVIFTLLNCSFSVEKNKKKIVNCFTTGCL